MKKFIVLFFVVMFWGFYEYTGGRDFQPLDESPFVEGREVDMTPLKPVVVATKEAPPRVIPAALSVEPAAKTIGSEAELVQAAKSQLRNVLEPAAKAEALTTQSGTFAEPAVLTALADEPEPNTDGEVARLSVDPADPILAAPESQPAEPAEDLRRVAGSRVNVRTGPGTNFNILTTLVRGDEVVVLSVNESGWARLRGPDGRLGWMAARLLTPKAE